MNVIGAITAGAAGLAAVLAGVNLYVSGRRELNKWTRETLVELFVSFLEASFAHNHACRAAEGFAPGNAAHHSLSADALMAHDQEMDTLIRLRLLAPSWVVTAAEALHEAEHKLADTCFLSGKRSVDAFDNARLPARHARAAFLESARSALRLRDTAPIGRDYHGDTRWGEVRALADGENQAISSKDSPQ